LDGTGAGTTLNEGKQSEIWHGHMELGALRLPKSDGGLMLGAE